MKSNLSGKAADGAGWRSLANPNDFSWLDGVLAAQSKKGFETSVALKTLFPKGVPAKGAQIRLFVKVVNNNGAAVPKGAVLPDQKSKDAWAIDSLYSMRVYPLN